MNWKINPCLNLNRRKLYFVYKHGYEKNEYDIYAEERRYIDWNFENIVKELEKLNPYRIYLGGYEATLDPD